MSTRASASARDGTTGGRWCGRGRVRQRRPGCAPIPGAIGTAVVVSMARAEHGQARARPPRGGQGNGQRMRSAGRAVHLSGRSGFAYATPSIWAIDTGTSPSAGRTTRATGRAMQYPIICCIFEV
jgi:hypothetical protein